jgi:membrane-anchored glycerophosphoryl diester phosphodiesterase (GDPDase)
MVTGLSIFGYQLWFALLKHLVVDLCLVMGMLILMCALVKYEFGILVLSVLHLQYICACFLPQIEQITKEIYKQLAMKH